MPHQETQRAQPPSPHSDAASKPRRAKVLAHSSVTKPLSVDDLMTSDDMDVSRWNSVDLQLPDLSQPARNVDTDVDASLNMDLVSFGMSVARLTTQQVRMSCAGGRRALCARWAEHRDHHSPAVAPTRAAAHCTLPCTDMTVGSNAQEWTDYRSPYRYFDSLRLLFLGRTSVLRRVWSIVGIITLVATAGCTWNHLCPSLALAMSPTPMLLLTAFVSLQVPLPGFFPNPNPLTLTLVHRLPRRA
jgi:hypothetical protein